jgi:hypothetical protein
VKCHACDQDTDGEVVLRVRLQHLGIWYRIDVYDHHGPGDFLLLQDQGNGIWAILSGAMYIHELSDDARRELQNWCEHAVAGREQEIRALPAELQPAARSKRALWPPHARGQ